LNVNVVAPAVQVSVPVKLPVVALDSVIVVEAEPPAGTGIDSGDAGIFTGDDLIDDVVVRTGQALFGSTIVQMSPPGNDFFNDHGDVAFLARLADGRFVVARANAPRIAAPVPEPGAASVAVALATLLALRRRRVQSAAGTNM
jgi:hypothetical protein